MFILLKPSLSCCYATALLLLLAATLNGCGSSEEPGEDNTSCSPNEGCDDWELCVEGTCVLNEAVGCDADTPNDLACDGYLCAADGYCETACSGARCAEGHVCQSGLCLRVECDAGNSNAPECNGFLCDSSGLCEDSCVGDRCSAGYLCSDSMCTPQECDAASPEDAACEGYLCSETYACESTCEGKGCVEDYACVNDECIHTECDPMLSSDPLCAGYQCNEQGFCMESCSASGCIAGYTCNTGVLSEGICVVESASTTFNRILVVSEVLAADSAFTTSTTPGPDVDAITLSGGAAGVVNASVVDWNIGMAKNASNLAVDGTTTATNGDRTVNSDVAAPRVEYQDADKAAGAPDVFQNDGTCELRDGADGHMFVMGSGSATDVATSGYLLVEFADPDSAGDTLTIGELNTVEVFEVNKSDEEGNVVCTTGATADYEDNYTVYAVSSDYDPRADALTAENSVLLGSAQARAQFTLPAAE